MPVQRETPNEPRVRAEATQVWQDAAPLRRGMTHCLRASSLACAAAGVALLATGVVAPVGGLLLAVSLGLAAGSVFSPSIGARVFDFPGADRPAGGVRPGEVPPNYYQPNYNPNANALDNEPWGQ